MRGRRPLAERAGDNVADSLRESVDVIEFDGLVEDRSRSERATLWPTPPTESDSTAHDTKCESHRLMS